MERWLTARLNMTLFSDRLPWRGRITWRPCGNSRGSSCWRSDWQEGLVLSEWTLHRPPLPAPPPHPWCCSCLQDWTCGSSEGWTKWLKLVLPRLKNTNWGGKGMKERVVFPNLNASDQVAPDEKDGHSIFLSRRGSLQFLWNPPPQPSLPVQSAGAGMPPCSPQSRHREHFQMFLKPAQACEKMEGRGGGGGCSFWRTTDSHGLTDQSAWELQYELYRVICWVICFVPVPPLQANYRICNSSVISSEQFMCLTAVRDSG